MATAVMERPARKQRRLELRLNESQRTLIEMASSLSSPTLTQWAVDALVERAEDDLESARVARLSADEFDAFAAALEEPRPEAAHRLLSLKPVWED